MRKHLVILVTLLAGALAATAAASPLDATVRVAAIGDYGEDTPGELVVADLVRGLTPDIVITQGDNCYDGRSIDLCVGKYYSDYIGDYQGDFGPGSPLNRFFPALGNHDYEDGTGLSTYLDYFTLPGHGILSTNTSGNERYYDFLYGPVHVFVLNSNRQEPDGRDSASVQAQWLQAQLGASSAPWKIVSVHHPPYSSGEHGGNAFLEWPFEAWASAVIAAHDHDYERIVRNGFPYFVNGLGGRSVDPFDPPVEGSVVRYNGDFGAMLLTADSLSITFEFHSVAAGGSLIDSFTLTRAQPDIAVSPTVNDFGSAPLGSSTLRSIEVRNEGSLELVVTATELVGSEAAEFALESGGAPFTLPPGGSRELVVRLTRLDEGVKRASLRVTSNDPDESPAFILLAGEITWPGGGAVAYEESVTGGASNTLTVTTSENIAGVSGHQYFAVISSKRYRTVTEVTGLDLTWTRVRTQCGGRQQTGVELWRGVGTPQSGAVTATLEGTATTAAILVARYSGADPAEPIGRIASANTNGPDGACQGGTDGASYRLDLEGVETGSVVLAAVAMRHRSHAAISGHTPRDLARHGALGDVVSAELLDQAVEGAGDLALEGAFNGIVDWAVIGVEIRRSRSGVVFEESVSGSASNSQTVTTSGSVSGELGDVVLAAIASTKDYEPVVGVTGLGLTWAPARAQCSGREKTGVEVWLGVGDPSDGPVTATLARETKNVVIVVSRYSGVDRLDPLEEIVSGNSNGEDGGCRNGHEESSYSLSVTNPRDNAAVLGVVTMLDRVHLPGTGYMLRDEVTRGGGGEAASVSVVERRFAPAGEISLKGGFDRDTDWAAIGLVLNVDRSGGITTDVSNAPPAILGNKLSLVVLGNPAPASRPMHLEFGLRGRQFVSLEIFDVSGRRVATVLQEAHERGFHRAIWSGEDARGRATAAGIYFVRLATDHDQIVKKVSRLR